MSSLWKERKVSKIRTVRFGDKLLILNGQDPIKYVDLTTGKMDAYKEYAVLVETAISDWHKGSIKRLKRTFTPENLTKTNILNVPLDAYGETYVKIRMVEK